ncbi:hypothetical protein [Kitasatospora sp. DSM 101779]|uniref:hypothetical protein n=1 Tax=Kitasatospora sp. DSM 101779 TaxID=2853165 RepID=UPI0021D917AF|nr:hypothetical protein [Kitasatospora sp. DSM 101779]MCU7827345.1 hypothetical protein [Kitasatospora sp. DSM 101779]
MLDEDNGAQGPSDDRDGSRPGRPPRPSGFEDTFWLVLLALIVVVCGLIGFLSDGSPAPGSENITGWH